MEVKSFHSIGFPSEWGHWQSKTTIQKWVTVSIQLVSPASGDLPGLISPPSLTLARFHSIGFPSEWGPGSAGAVALKTESVSIQLVSPASGDLMGENSVDE